MTVKEEWASLLLHPGWLRLKAFADKQWQDELSNHLRTAVSDTNDAQALQKMRQIIVAKDAVERLLRYPDEQMQSLTTAATQTETSFTRGGYKA